MKFLIVDDHPVVRDGLSAMLTRMGPNIVVLEAADGAEGLSAAVAHPDLDAVFLDLNLPAIGQMSALRAFRDSCPHLPVIIFSASETVEDARRAIAEGARGYIPKSAARQTLLPALNMVLAGEVYRPAFLHDPDEVEGVSQAQGQQVAARQGLTPRQIEVLRLMAAGHANKDIAYRLGLSEKTVKVHVSGIFKFLGVVNRTQAAASARAAGLV